MARSLPCFADKSSSQHYHHHIPYSNNNRSHLRNRNSNSSDPQILNYILNAIQRDHRIPKRFSFNSTTLSRYCT
ncbi:unnamed protein product [Lepeophtheirus salmonis]|uniref:(salmon louse) hypothetical protein n=1 Tax=Lepeophtheirus salmonis TaxID=72036 RepID=A0A7R8HAN2_LEPSM|nr:unnamed protein product [Lepeophtheirus salmonis]CAF2958992.1 unnamed protein product [Lepeophtheirus salmonis]